MLKLAQTPGQKAVSIHAPARGATSYQTKAGCHAQVSIHAPARGATFCGLNMTPELRTVSIHAPARGATAYPVGVPPPPCFNPRAREGRDTPFHAKRDHVFQFQSTRPRGARHFAV